MVTGLLFSARAVGAQPQPNHYCHDQLGHGKCHIAPINQDQLLTAFLNEPQRMNQTDVERFCKSVGFTANDLQQSIGQLSCQDNYLETVKPCMNELLNITQTCSGATGDISDDDLFSPSPSNEPQFNQLSYWFLLAAPLLGLYRNIDQFYKATSFTDLISYV